MPQRKDTYTTPSGVDFTVYSYGTPDEIPGFTPPMLDTGRIKQIQNGPAVLRWLSVTPFMPTFLFEGVPDVPAPAVLPAGFKSIFGPRPVSRGDSKAFRRATGQWENNLATFVGVINETHPADNDAIEYDMGLPRYYENIHGRQVRFPKSQDPDFQADMDGFTGFPGLVIVMYQNRLTNAEIPIPADLMHPLAPPVLLAKADKVRSNAD